jgi:hypothetical protein
LIAWAGSAWGGAGNPAAAALLDAISSGRDVSDEVKEPDFDALRARDDFQELLAEVEAKARPPAQK